MGVKINPRTFFIISLVRRAKIRNYLNLRQLNTYYWSLGSPVLKIEAELWSELPNSTFNSALRLIECSISWQFTSQYAGWCRKFQPTSLQDNWENEKRQETELNCIVWSRVEVATEVVLSWMCCQHRLYWSQRFRRRGLQLGFWRWPIPGQCQPLLIDGL